MEKLTVLTAVAFMAVGAIADASVSAGERRLSLDDYRDKMRGAWLGQMIGVAWGQPTEFGWENVLIPENKVPTWTDDFLARMAYDNDDLYVEMTFLKSLEDHGLDVTIRQAGIDYANSEYYVVCANGSGRSNLRSGIAPPDCAHPKLHGRPNDIDYQIESDYSGIIAPGCPQEAVRLGNVFGRLVNFGDGVWAGQFVGAAYAEAFFTADVDRIVDAGLRAIPAESDYAQMIRDVRAWRREFPDDWTKAWERIRDKYSKDRSVNEGWKRASAVNAGTSDLRDSTGGIDVRLNGAMVLLGLLYGGGDPERSMLIAMRGGWDSDCNPSTVGGILMCARGAKAVPEKFLRGFDPVRKFGHTDYCPKTLFAVCEKLARAVVVRNGGRVETDADGRESFVVPDRAPVPDKFVPSWKAPPPEGAKYSDEEMRRINFCQRIPDQQAMKGTNATDGVQKTLDALYPGWTTSANGPDMDPGFRRGLKTTRGLAAVGVVTHPPKPGCPVVLSRTFKVPAGDPQLKFDVASAPHESFRLAVRINGAAVLGTVLGNPQANDERWFLQSYAVSLDPWIGQTVTIELVDEPNGWRGETAFWSNIRLTANTWCR